MKDTVITAHRKKTELKVWLACFAAAFLINVWAIIEFDRSWTELFTQLGFVTVMSVVFYAAAGVVRLAVSAAAGMFRRK